MADGRPISSSRIATGDIARHSFAVVRRGFDTDEVRAYLQSVARSLEVLEENEQELRTAVAEAEERAAHPVVDEATLTASLGQHSAQILRHAHEEAARIVAQAQEGAASLLRETQSQVDELQARSEASAAERVVEVELLATNAQHEASVESERIVAAAVMESEAIIARAKDEGRALLEQVQEARRRVLADLAGRRRTLGMHIEALRAARDEMAASVHGVRDRVDGILAQLDQTDEAARTAAMAVSDQFRLHAQGEGSEDEEALGDVVGEAMNGVSADDSPTASTTAGGSVDELFARIRAGSKETQPGGSSQAAPTASDAATTETTASEKPDAERNAPAEAAAGGAPAGGATAGGTPAGGATAEGASVAGAGSQGATTEVEAIAGPDDGIIATRDELLGPITARLSRTIKRALGDDQNRLLDRLRSRPSLSVDELLGDESDHVETFANASRDDLNKAFAAGAAFGGARAALPAHNTVDHAAGELAQMVVTRLRRQIAGGGGEPTDRIGASFREWRGERVERLVGDFATQAFSAGVVVACRDGKVRWVVTNSSGCSDCEDNSLAGAVSVHETFPTGHVHPPAHSGCRCLLAPTDP